VLTLAGSKCHKGDAFPRTDFAVCAKIFFIFFFFFGETNILSLLKLENCYALVQLVHQFVWVGD